MMERKVEIEHAGEAAGLFGAIDGNTSLIETLLGVELRSLPDGIGIYGEDEGVLRAEAVVRRLLEIQRTGEPVTRQLVQYLSETARDGSVEQVAGYSPDCICVTAKGRPIKGKTRGQNEFVKAIAENDITFAIGPAGTGKTFLAVAYGASLLLKGEVDRLVVCRPAVEAGERLGFLPGDLNEKVDPYLAPIWEALSDIMGGEALRRRRDRGEIEVAPIAFMRGRTLSHAFVIVDEAQNASRLQMKMVLTRLGEGARMAVTGDPSQVDLVNTHDSGLSHAVGLLENVKGVGVARFQASDVVRHPLVERIVTAYENEARRNGSP